MMEIKNLEFKINNYLTLKLENDNTIIYILGVKYRQCKSLLLETTTEKLKTDKNIDSIDEAAEILDKSIGYWQGDHFIYKIPPETEFWGHCSNIQVWYEQDYDTRLLHSNLAFPLLKKLSDIGDTLAKKKFKEEIALRLESGFIPTTMFLVLNGYLRYLSCEEIKTILESLPTFPPNSHTGKVFQLFPDEPPYLFENELYFLMEHPAIRLLEGIAETGDVGGDFEDWMRSCLSTLLEKCPTYLKERLLMFLGKCRIRDFTHLFNLGIMEYVSFEQFISILLFKNTELYEDFIQIDGDYVYGRILNEFREFFYTMEDRGSEAIDRRVIEILESASIEDIKLIIMFYLIEGLSLENLTFCVMSPKIRLIDKILSFIKGLNEGGAVRGVNPETWFFIRLINIIYLITTNLDKDLLISSFRQQSKKTMVSFRQSLNNIEKSELYPAAKIDILRQLVV